MVFSSLLFICIFLPVVLILCLIIPARWRNAFLLFSSLIFYGWGEPKYILLMAATAAVDYAAGLLISYYNSRSAQKAAKAVLAVTVILNIGTLCFFKYTGFVVESISALIGAQSPIIKLALPVGISFYTFQTLSYVIDVYRGRVAVQRNFINFFMFVTIFPQLIAGPIVRYSDIESRLVDRPIYAEKFADGIFGFCIGLAKKVIIANRMGVVFDSATSGESTFLSALIAAVSFTFQIYFDFSGYSDMAIGMGKMLGFDFPENFRYPYEADSITDFWRRWHITLSTWFREYLYIPLGGNRKGIKRQIFNLFVVWSLTGLWHGAGWNFLFWGIYFFLILVCEKLFLLKFLKKLPAFIRHIYTLVLVVIGWVLFYSESLSSVVSALKSLFGVGVPLADNGALYLMSTSLIMFAVCIIASTHYPAKIANVVITRLTVSKPGLRVVIRGAFAAILLILSIALLTGDSYNPFLYFRF